MRGERRDDGPPHRLETVAVTHPELFRRELVIRVLPVAVPE
jgi:hypothetical protein